MSTRDIVLVLDHFRPERHAVTQLYSKHFLGVVYIVDATGWPGCLRARTGSTSGVRRCGRRWFRCSRVRLKRRRCLYREYDGEIPETVREYGLPSV